MKNTWWLLVGGRKRLGKHLAEGLAKAHSLVLTSSQGWEQEGTWIKEMELKTPLKTLQWDAFNPALMSHMMADLSRLRSEGIVFHHAIILSGSFPEQAFGTWEPGELRNTLELNLIFPMLVAQAIAPHMAVGGSMQFVLDTAIHRPMLKHLPYTAAKSVLASLVSGLAQCLAPRLRVAGHALGVVMPDKAEKADDLANLNLLKQNGTPEDLLRAVNYVANSPYLTGDILTLDGGRRWR